MPRERNKRDSARGSLHGQSTELATPSRTRTHASPQDEVYNVERILKHKVHKSGGIQYLIKWEGYPSSENSWEDEENLLGAQDCLMRYHYETDSMPGLKATKRKTKKAGLTSENEFQPKNSSSSKRQRAKRDREDEANQDFSNGNRHNKPGRSTTGAAAPAHAGKRKKMAAERMDSPPLDFEEQSPDTMRHASPVFPEEDWDLHIRGVTRVAKVKDFIDPVTKRRPENGLVATVQWLAEYESRHACSTLHEKCPLKLIDFYERHLDFPVTIAQS